MWLPHRFCVNNETWIIALSVIGDASIALFYLMIPVGMLLLISRGIIKQYKAVFVAFAAFILLCGATHVNDIIVIWYPWYVWQEAVKIACALASLVAGVLLFQAVGKLSGREKQANGMSGALLVSILALVVEIVRLAMGH